MMPSNPRKRVLRRFPLILLFCVIGLALVWRWCWSFAISSTRSPRRGRAACGSSARRSTPNCWGSIGWWLPFGDLRTHGAAGASGGAHTWPLCYCSGATATVSCCRKATE